MTTRTTIVVLIASAILIVVALVALWRRRARARAWLEAMAAQYGLRRKPTETDEELRARMRAVLATTGRGTREDLRILVKDALWGHGYRRVDVEITPEPATGTVRAHAKTPVPVGVLRVIERELEDRIPVTVRLELSAEEWTR